MKDIEKTKISKGELEGKKETLWMLDSACSSHMSFQSEIVIKERSEKVEIATAKHGRSIYAESRGTVLGSSIVDESREVRLKMKEVLYVPDIGSNLMPSLVKRDKRIILDESGASIYEATIGELVAEGTFEEDAFIVRVNVNTSLKAEKICFSAKESDRDLWHRRLGHCNFRYMRLMYEDDLVNGLPKLPEGDDACDSCIMGKMTRLPFQEVTVEGTSRILERIHVDLCGPMPVESMGGSKYMLVIVDEFSRRYFVEFLRAKSEAATEIERFIERRETETGCKVKYVRSDNGTEFINSPLLEYYYAKGIKSERTTIHSPQSNGIAERANKTLINMARTILIDAGLPNEFWAEAVWTSAYVHNITPTKKRDTVPLEMWNGKKPLVKHLRIFSCRVFYRFDDVNKKKFDVRSKSAVFVGYSKNRKAYCVFDLEEQKIREIRDVIFKENEMGYTKRQSFQITEPACVYIPLDRPLQIDEVDIVIHEEGQINNGEIEEHQIEVPE